MGIALSFLDFFDICHRQGALADPVVALGSLTINEPEREIEAFAARNPSWHRDPARAVHSLFRDRYAVKDYRDCDLNGAADLQIDLNRPLDAGLRETAGTITNGATLEHVFDVAQAVRNVHDMARLGGTIVHLAPISWYNHGYYNFNPRFFAAVAESNKYALVAEAFWLDVPGHAGEHKASRLRAALDRVKARLGRGAAASYAVRGLAHPVLYVTFDGTRTRYHDVLWSRLSSVNPIPANAVYLAAHRKSAADAFVFPYDVQG